MGWGDGVGDGSRAEATGRRGPGQGGDTRHREPSTGGGGWVIESPGGGLGARAGGALIRAWAMGGRLTGGLNPASVLSVFRTSIGSRRLRPSLLLPIAGRWAPWPEVTRGEALMFGRVKG